MSRRYRGKYIDCMPFYMEEPDFGEEINQDSNTEVLAEETDASNQ